MGKEILTFGDIEIGKNKFYLIICDDEYTFTVHDGILIMTHSYLLMLAISKP